MKNIYDYEYDTGTGFKRKVYTGRYRKTDTGWEKPFICRVLGYDPAKRLDGASVVIVDKCKDNIYRVIGVTNWKQMNWITQYRNIEHLIGLLEIDAFIYDANGPGSNCEDIFKELNMDATPRYPNASKIDLIPIYAHTKEFKLNTYREIKRLMTQHRLKFPRNIPHLEDQFAALEIDNTDKISHRKGTFIDIPSALMLAMSYFITKKRLTKKTRDIYFFD